jgi:putative membrane-bound dehydrogenase-like protein
MKRWMLVLGVALALSAWATVDLAAQKKKPAPQPPNEIHEPERAVANLDVHPELQATLFVSEPKITNPTNLDIDHRGRIWLCDVVNYRGNNGKRKEGDRILILEDTDGDGVCDKVTTFYQGRDVDSAMGICVLGNKVIVSCSPNVFVFHFDENDKITKREVLFTKTGVPQHDHSAHSFVFGPDGRLYWNFGNTGQAVHDKDGKPVVDLMGNKVVDNGKPYWGGMVFRCELDGSNFETLGHNFRNNYEVAVDSFGTLWQSDNDDDGNRGVRINYVMEYGNYGYRDEFTGAGWQAKRTNMEKDIPLRHWHLNDPGVVPNLLQTYQGSPTGICVYEGSLLPKVFRNQAIHCDAGPSIVRAYPVTPEGAGYKASIVNILDGAKKNNWFRPADVCVAPDGSLFVTDWYDPGVGGHQQKDLDRGRVFRVAPNASPRPSGGEGPGVKGQKYVVPKAKFETIEDNIEALKSPNNATRHLAWTNLHKAGAKAEAALLKMYESKVPHERARALWLLGRIPGKGQHYVNLASADKDADIRIVGIRLARQLKLDVAALIGGAARLTYDASPAVRRECAIALHESKSREKAFAWAELASRIDGADRWYLEALGIGAQGDWDRCLEAWFSAPRGGRRLPYSQGERDIIWRSRAGMTPRLLADMIAHEKMPSDELPRLLRAFDFQADSDTKNEALVKLAFGDYSDPERRKLITTEAINRLTKFDVKNNPKHAAALDKVLDGAKGTAGYVEMVGKFNVSNRFPELLAIAQKTPTEQIGVDAIRVLLDRDQVKLIETGLAAKDPVLASNTAQAIAGAQHDKANALLLPIVLDAKQDLELRRQATRALARTKSGAERLIALAREKKLGSELNIAAGGAMASAPWADIRKQAADLFPQPTTKDKKPLPAIPDLVKMKGNAGNGQAIFAKAGTCAKCHIVNGEGKNVGPDLSEIGKKLAREAMFESILYPSASILHNYETWVVVTNKGTTANGLLVSKTAEEVSLKDSEGIVRTFKMGDVDSLSRSSVSLMPADLHQAISTQELVDVVEYLLTLREAKKAK